MLVKADGTEAEKAYYLPWGGARGDETITSTDYGYTGQMREGDIYYYGARWYDLSIGRFMQADTIVPLNVQGTQAFDRYAYVNNNPVKYVDPNGHLALLGAIAIGVGVGSLVTYGIQVANNLKNDMSFKEALTTDISVDKIAIGALAGGVLGGGAFALGSYLATGAIPITSTLCIGKCPELATKGIEAIQRAEQLIEEAGVNVKHSLDAAGNTVYQYIVDGKPQYFGITNNFNRRAAEHYSAHGWTIEAIKGLTNLTRFQARAVEEVLIQHYGLENLVNAIHSVGIHNKLYNLYIEVGTIISESLGLLQ